MSIATTGISDLLTAQDQPLGRNNRAGGEAFSSILGGFSSGPADAVSLPTMIVGNPTPVTDMLPEGAQENIIGQAEGEADFIFNLTLPSELGTPGVSVEAPATPPPASAAPEAGVAEIDVSETGDPASILNGHVPAAVLSKSGKAGQKAEWAMSAAAGQPAVAPDSVGDGLADKALAVAVTPDTDAEVQLDADGASVDAGQPEQNPQMPVAGQVPPVIQMPVVTAAATVPTDSESPVAAPSVPSVSETMPAVPNNAENPAPVLNATMAAPFASDVSGEAPAETPGAKRASVAPMLADIQPDVLPVMDKAKPIASALPMSTEASPAVSGDMTAPVQELAEKLSAVTHGKVGDGSGADNQENTGQLPSEAAGRNGAPGQMQAAQHSLAQQLAGTAPAGVPFGHVVREAVHSAHQAMIEDLMIGNSVEDQWVDRLAQDVETLVSSDNREARLHLRPRELGDLSIRLEMQDGKARVHFTVDTAAAQSLIADAAPRLQAMMENRGFRLEQSSVDVGSGGSSAGQQGSGGNGRQDNQPFVKVPASELAGIARRVARQTGFERYA